MIRNSVVIGSALIKSSFRLFGRNRHDNVIPFTWGKPEVGCIKLNFDGASKFGSGNASIGGVCRNHEGVFLLGYAERIGKATSSVAELVAAKRGLELALKNDWLNIWLEGDAKVVVDLLMRRVGSKSEEDIRHARDIRAMIAQFDDFSASHIYREGNKVADKLAEMAYKTEKARIWRDVPPDELLRFLQQDAEGRIILRKAR